MTVSYPACQLLEESNSCYINSRNFLPQQRPGGMNPTCQRQGEVLYVMSHLYTYNKFFPKSLTLTYTLHFGYYPPQSLHIQLIFRKHPQSLHMQVVFKNTEQMSYMYVFIFN
jgi:hypothetical protein